MKRNEESPENAARRLAAKELRKGFEWEALHTYTSQEGHPLYYRIRLKHPDTGEKWIRPMKLNGAGYSFGEPEYPNGKPLYRLHDLFAAQPSEPVVVVEGELCADRLAKIGILATTSGAFNSAKKADWSPLASRTILIWPDNDEVGQQYGREAAELLGLQECDARIVDVRLLNLPPKGDVVDWLQEYPGATANDLFALPTLEIQKPENLQTSISKDMGAIQRLASMSPLEYDRERKAVAKAMRIRPATLDKMVEDIRKGTVDDGLGIDDIVPWPDSIIPAQLLTDISNTVQRFIICEVETAHAVALWVAMTWFIDVVQVAPLAVITAPEKRCGKSQLLSVMGKLVKRPLPASNISPAALFRSIDAWKPTLLVDEVDAFMRENEELRGLLNSGHTRELAFVVRVEGEKRIPTIFNTWGAKALAGIGRIAETLMDRAIILKLRRKRPSEQTDLLRYAEPELFSSFAAKLARFAEDFREEVRLSRPDIPKSLNDRAQDNWEPLLSIADIAGKDWPGWARQAALKLSGLDDSAKTIGNELLADIREVFETKEWTRISTKDLIFALCEDEEKQWFLYDKGRPISARQIASNLKEYGIESKNIKFGYNDVKKGYEKDQFEEIFSRYLPSNTFDPLPHSKNADFEVADGKGVAATHLDAATVKGPWNKAGSGIAAKKTSIKDLQQFLKRAQVFEQKRAATFAKRRCG